MNNVVAIATKPNKVFQIVISTILIFMMDDNDTCVGHFADIADNFHARPFHYVPIRPTTVLPIRVTYPAKYLITPYCLT
jgi:hypothetical protein